MQTGQFFWYDVMTTDVPAAAKFYSAVIGWGVEKQMEGYSLFTVNGQGVAGLMPIPEHAKGVPPCWMGYVRVDDVDAKCAELEKAGGKIHRPPFDVPGVVRMAVVADPQGAGFLIAHPLPTNAPPPPAIGTPGTMGWRELMALNWESAFSFYEKLFGWRKTEAMDMGPMGTYQLFASGPGDAVGGMMTKPAEVPMPYWGYYINVEAIDAAAKRVTDAGGKIINGPMEVPGPMYVVQCLDPMGAYFALVAPKH